MAIGKVYDNTETGKTQVLYKNWNTDIMHGYVEGSITNMQNAGMNFTYHHPFQRKSLGDTISPEEADDVYTKCSLWVSELSKG